MAGDLTYTERWVELRCKSPLSAAGVADAAAFVAQAFNEMAEDTYFSTKKGRAGSYRVYGDGTHVATVYEDKGVIAIKLPPDFVQYVMKGEGFRNTEFFGPGAVQFQSEEIVRKLRERRFEFLPDSSTPQQISLTRDGITARVRFFSEIDRGFSDGAHYAELASLLGTHSKEVFTAVYGILVQKDLMAKPWARLQFGSAETPAFLAMRILDVVKIQAPEAIRTKHADDEHNFYAAGGKRVARLTQTGMGKFLLVVRPDFVHTIRRELQSFGFREGEYEHPRFAPRRGGPEREAPRRFACV